jgi:hypothetical protein
MLLALLLSISLSDWAPARWISADPRSLDLLKDTPINCLLLERDQWSAALVEQAGRQGVVALGVLRPGRDLREAARLAQANGLAGVVLEGEFPGRVVGQFRDSLAGSGLTVIEMTPRRSMRLRDAQQVAATYQGVWPGIQVQEGDTARAGPSGSPWINTNMGFLLFARASTPAPIWIANPPPEKQVLRVESYLHAICDAAVLGARWVVALDPDFRARLLRREPQALHDWKRMTAHLQYFEKHKEWRTLQNHGPLAVVQDADSGALVSGGILDMLATRHTPLRVIPRWKLTRDALRGSSMVLNLEADLLEPQQKATLAEFTSAGNRLLTTPPELKPPLLHADQITVAESEVGRIEDLWKGMNTAISHANPGVHMYNVASILTSVLSEAGGRRLILHLVNYSGYPVENVTIRFPGAFERAALLAPESPGRKLEIFPAKDESSVEIDQVDVCATLILE